MHPRVLMQMIVVFVDIFNSSLESEEVLEEFRGANVKSYLRRVQRII